MTVNDFSPKAVMVVDDEPDIVHVFRRFLEVSGYSVSSFTNPAEVLEYFKLNRERFGLIISDVRMPILNGLEFATRIREIDASVPFILMSAFETISSEINLSLNVSQFLQKPIMLSQLKLMVSKYIPMAVE